MTALPYLFQINIIYVYQHTLDPFCKKKQDQDINEQFLDQIGGLDLGDDLIQLLQKPITMVDEEIEDQESDVSYDEADEQ